MQRPRRRNYIDFTLITLRVGIISVVIWGLIGKLFLRSGNAYALSEWLDIIVSGLAQGSLYALIALGYTMVYGLLSIINFAHGEFFMGGAMTSAILVAQPLAQAGYLEQFPLLSLQAIFFTSILTSLLMAIVTERVAYRRLRHAPRLVSLITAIGASVFWQSAFQKLYGSFLFGFPRVAFLKGTTIIFGFSFQRVDVVVIVASVVAMLELHQFVQHSRIGRMLRAVAENKDVAMLMGIDVDRAITTTFAISGAMAGFAGVLYAFVFTQVNYDMGFVPGIKAFTAAVLGGIGSIPGAAFGGLFLGVAEAVGPPLVLEGLGIEGPYQLKDVIAFTLLVLVLIFRPQGIFGEVLSDEKV